MENAEMWLTPLLFLPGVALLIMSTSLRYGQIHTEFHNLLAEKNASKNEIANHLLKRSTLFRNALFSLYVSFGLFSLASLLGGLTFQWMEVSKWIVMGLSCCGILSLVYASYELIRESMFSLDVIKAHCSQLLENRTN